MGVPREGAIAWQVAPPCNDNVAAAVGPEVEASPGEKALPMRES